MPREISVHGLRLEEPPILPAARRALKRVLEPTLEYSGEILARRHLRFVFRSPSRVETAQVGNRSYPVHPLHKSAGRVYWLGVEVELAPVAAEYEFHSISLVLFLRRSKEVEFDAVLRAEWEASRSSHAQPHWHVYQTVAEQAERVRNLILDDTGYHDMGEEWLPLGEDRAASLEQQALKRLHFAMAARWHAPGTDRHYEAPDPSRVELWIQGCLEYIRGQLEYLSEALPPHQPF